ncbi:hypothetical protein SHY49_10205, partial [Streptococcus suis]|uniref:hypothetical protein n=1 Tax=Streptococcus suis TaxID=1307 RepID=UPI0029C3B336
PQTTQIQKRLTPSRLPNGCRFYLLFPHFTTNHFGEIPQIISPNTANYSNKMPQITPNRCYFTGNILYQILHIATLPL